MKRYERTQQFTGFGVSVPVILGIWLVCALIAGAVWESIASATPGSAAVSFSSLLPLGIGFGFAGVGLVCLALDMIRQP